ncbi:MAG: Zn-dependent membrane protease YugP, partial [Saprospiraceae bacterium]
LKVRSALVPAVQASSRLQQFLFIGFIFGSSMAGALGNIFLLLLVVTFGMAALFSFITLPVEFDASRRALVWLDDTGTTQGAEYDGAKDALWWAAMTYVASALSALVMFLYFALQLMGRD